MATEVIHGQGKPRIVMPTSVLITGTVAALTGGSYTVEISGTPALTDAVLAHFLITVNGDAGATKGKITSYNAINYTVTVASYDNGFPALSAALTIKDIVIDLPYCDQLIEEWEFVYSKVKVRKSDKKKLRTLEGFYYYAILDYGSYANKDMLVDLSVIFTASRTNFYFYPRVDNKDLYYECELAEGAALKLAQLKHHQGHRLFDIELEGLALLNTANLGSDTSSSVTVDTIIMDDEAMVYD